MPYQSKASTLHAYAYISNKTVLRELELKKPQLDELMQTAENLKSESNRHNLHGKAVGPCSFNGMAQSIPAYNKIWQFHCESTQKCVFAEENGGGNGTGQNVTCSSSIILPFFGRCMFCDRSSKMEVQAGQVGSLWEKHRRPIEGC
ncbi:Dystrophin, isoforms A/C/F/G/H [Orchesella cincta]|uniref:Dystrophin, isoforms A/C/F/G/H n=1 Tax=Orchesella cincta TaxID=48709 RepID=A0A1D2MUT5_ORCCI|nr:Dystrophin, isoforms A/C/F/G/H [Orchesella cincta]